MPDFDFDVLCLTYRIIEQLRLELLSVCYEYPPQRNESLPGKLTGYFVIDKTVNDCCGWLGENNICSYSIDLKNFNNDINVSVNGIDNIEPVVFDGKYNYNDLHIEFSIYNDERFYKKLKSFQEKIKYKIYSSLINLYDKSLNCKLQNININTKEFNNKKYNNDLLNVKRTDYYRLIDLFYDQNENYQLDYIRNEVMFIEKCKFITNIKINKINELLKLNKIEYE